MLPAPLRLAQYAFDDSSRTLVQQRSSLHVSLRSLRHTNSLTSALQNLIGPARHSHTASPCLAPIHRPANRTSVSCLLHTFLSSCGCCALQLPAARRCGDAALAAPWINDQEPRAGYQEPLLWDCAAWSCIAGTGQDVQLSLVAQFDL